MYIIFYSKIYNNIYFSYNAADEISDKTNTVFNIYIYEYDNIN